MKFFSTFPLTPTPFNNRGEYTKYLFLPSPVCLAFILRQSSVILVHKTNASNKNLMGERLLAPVEVSQRQPDCITWLQRLQGGSSFLFFQCPGCCFSETLWHLEMWSVDFSVILWLQICSAAFFLLVWPDWHRTTCFFWVTLGLNNLQFCHFSNRFAAWSLPSASGHGSMGNTLRAFQLLLPVIEICLVMFQVSLLIFPSMGLYQNFKEVIF